MYAWLQTALRWPTPTQVVQRVHYERAHLRKTRPQCLHNSKHIRSTVSAQTPELVCLGMLACLPQHCLHTMRPSLAVAQEGTAVETAGAEDEEISSHCRNCIQAATSCRQSHRGKADTITTTASVCQCRPTCLFDAACALCYHHSAKTMNMQVRSDSRA